MARPCASTGDASRLALIRDELVRPRLFRDAKDRSMGGEPMLV
jgi:hypothetical protein